MNKIIGVVRSINGDSFDLSITIKIGETSALVLSKLIGSRVEIELKEKSIEPTLPEQTAESFALKQEGVKHGN